MVVLGGFCGITDGDVSHSESVMPTALNVRKPTVVEKFVFKDDGIIPNSRLPVLVYRQVLPSFSDPLIRPVDELQEMVHENGWKVKWMSTIYSRVHYHSTAHEALAVVSGSGKIKFGGSILGTEIMIREGDFVVIPAGVGHQNLGASADFAIVGMYPNGTGYDMIIGQRVATAMRETALMNLQGVPKPENDPLFGKTGYLVQHWR
jgi:uncharacterized protein YjlB